VTATAIGGTASAVPFDPDADVDFDALEAEIAAPVDDVFAAREGKHHRQAGDTERGAAKAVAPRTGTGRFKVLAALVEHGGMIDEEIAARTGLRHYTAAPRRKELVEGGFVVDSGSRRKTTTGTAAIVWTATAKGVDAAGGVGRER
jgi:hypothetical protein